MLALTLGELALELQEGLQAVVGQPGLGEDDTVLSVDVFALEVAEDGLPVVVLCDSGLEEDAVGCAGLCLEGGDTERVVLVEEIRGKLAKVLVRGRDGAISDQDDWQDMVSRPGKAVEGKHRESADVRISIMSLKSSPAGMRRSHSARKMEGTAPRRRRRAFPRRDPPHEGSSWSSGSHSRGHCCCVRASLSGELNASDKRDGRKARCSPVMLRLFCLFRNFSRKIAQERL